MNESTLVCQDDRRRQAIHQQERLNGLDYLEVSEDQRSLYVYFLGAVPTNLTKNNILIEGGRRISNIQVIAVEIELPPDSSLDGRLKVMVDRYGDFSDYSLNLNLVETDDLGKIRRDDNNQPIPLSGFDLHYARLEFNFKVGCPSDLDCQTESICLPEARIEPEINYLAKDYASFRQLILDRLALTIPAWKERHIPDLGITLVELLAYVGDYLSYYQDAVATEAYLDTARQRVSVRRHARLVDYTMHEGCNSRTWVWIETDRNQPPLKPSEIFFITSYPGASNQVTVLNELVDLQNIPVNHYEVFEPITTKEIQLNPAHNEIHFYTWGDQQCCLPKGSTQATLYERWQPPAQPNNPTPVQSEYDDGSEDPNLSATAQPPKLSLTPGDILIFEEVKGAKTGNEADADLSHRHAVRLTNVKIATDALYSAPIVEIEWAAEDALPFSLCISALGEAPGCCLIDNISVTRGNVILVDRGRRIDPDDLGKVDKQDSIELCDGQGRPTEIVTVPKPFRPKLKQAPLTFSQPLSAADLKKLPASKLLAQDPRQALPQITKLIGFPAENPVENNHFPPEREEWKWSPKSDLLSSYSQDRDFIVEMDDEGYAHLRFGDGELGKQPKFDSHFYATYRVGNGTSGNIGADSIAHIVFRQQPLSGLIPHNPFSAQGGTDPEPLAEVKLFAPTAFRKKLQRAITAQDYADIVMRDFPTQVQRAAATLRWTGSWYEVLVAIDPRNTEVASPKLLTAIERHLYLYRQMGRDLVVRSAVYVPLAIAMHVCVLPDYLRGHVKVALMDAFSSRRLANGQLGFFHPDNLTFGTGIYLSQLIAAARSIEGVMSVQVTRLKRLEYVANPASMPTKAESSSAEILNGLLPLKALEIARLDNDSSFPENGVLKFEIGGGR